MTMDSKIWKKIDSTMNGPKHEDNEYNGDKSMNYDRYQ